jgi:hypothetical protein
MYNSLYHTLPPARKRLFIKETAILFPLGQ